MDNYCLAVGCVVLKQDKVLLVRHTYGSAKGKLLIPGGYCNEGELPEDTAKREVMEETKVVANANAILGIRCSRRTWYMIMVMDYIGGEPESDYKENCEAMFMNMDEALTREDVTYTTKVVIKALLRKNSSMLFSDADYKDVKGNDFELYI